MRRWSNEELTILASDRLIVEHHGDAVVEGLLGANNSPTSRYQRGFDPWRLDPDAHFDFSVDGEWRSAESCSVYRCNCERLQGVS